MKSSFHQEAISADILSILPSARKGLLLFLVARQPLYRDVFVVESDILKIVLTEEYGASLNST